MKTPTKDKSSMPDVIWAWYDKQYDVITANNHGDVRYTPNGAKKYTKTATINAQLDEILETLNEVANKRELYADSNKGLDAMCGIQWAYNKLKEMRGDV